jgi:cyclase
MYRKSTAPPRIIARLDVKGPNLVKGIRLEGLRVLGIPDDFAKYYCMEGIDELIYIDIVASLYNRNSIHDLISRTAKEIFIPLTVGGGIRSISDIKSVLRAGADKVAINTAAIKSPALITEASRYFGSSTIVVSIEAIRHPNGEYIAYFDNGRENSGLNVIEWAQKAEKLGAGEILLTSVDKEGTGLGFEYDLITAVSSKINIPLIACGGAGNKEHIRNVLSTDSASAVAIGSLLHYDYINRIEHKSIAEGAEGNTEFLRNKRLSSKIDPAGVKEIKDFLQASGFKCRI